MNSRDPYSITAAIADVQRAADSRHIAINKVGIKSIRHPIRIAERGGGAHGTIATFNMYVGLPHHVKGTHMSRFVEILNTNERVISVASFRAILREMVVRLEAESGYIEMSFPYFMHKSAPVSGVKSLLDYEVSFSGAIEAGVETFTLKVVVPVTSLCPCSKKISDYGAHNQRSHISISARTGDVDTASEPMCIEELVDIAEREASCELYGILKRPDEKYVTERAYDNPKFVEDVVRDVAAALARDPRVQWYQVESENFESIHNHSAYALIESSALAR